MIGRQSAKCYVFQLEGIILSIVCCGDDVRMVSVCVAWSEYDQCGVVREVERALLRATGSTETAVCFHVRENHGGGGVPSGTPPPLLVQRHMTEIVPCDRLP